MINTSKEMQDEILDLFQEHIDKYHLIYTDEYWYLNSYHLEILYEEPTNNKLSITYYLSVTIDVNNEIKSDMQRFHERLLKFGYKNTVSFPKNLDSNVQFIISPKEQINESISNQEILYQEFNDDNLNKFLSLHNKVKMKLGNINNIVSFFENLHYKEFKFIRWTQINNTPIECDIIRGWNYINKMNILIEEFSDEYYTVIFNDDYIQHIYLIDSIDGFNKSFSDKIINDVHYFDSKNFDSKDENHTPDWDYKKINIDDSLKFMIEHKFENFNQDDYEMSLKCNKNPSLFYAYKVEDPKKGSNINANELNHNKFKEANCCNNFYKFEDDWYILYLDVDGDPKEGIYLCDGLNGLKKVYSDRQIKLNESKNDWTLKNLTKDEIQEFFETHKGYLIDQKDIHFFSNLFGATETVGKLIEYKYTNLLSREIVLSNSKIGKANGICIRNGNSKKLLFTTYIYKFEDDWFVIVYGVAYYLSDGYEGIKLLANGIPLLNK